MELRRLRLVEGPIQEEWMEDAACLGVDPDLWFPSRGSTGTRAKAICAGCPVRVECLDYALENNEQHGIWGGLDLPERRRVAKWRAS